MRYRRGMTGRGAGGDAMAAEPRRWLALAGALLAACSARGAPPHGTSAGAGSGSPPTVAPEAPPEAPAEPARPVTRAPHGAPIELLAVTEAGDAAISADTRHGLRLWPSLDG